MSIETLSLADSARVKPFKDWAECEWVGYCQGYDAAGRSAYVAEVDLGRPDSHYYRLTGFGIPEHPKISMWFAPWELEELGGKS